MRGPEIEFIYFDLGNVLISFDPEITCRNLAERVGVKVERARAAIYDSGLQDRFEHGEVSGEQYADTVRADLGLSAEQMPTAALLDAISEMFTPIESMREIVRDAADHRKTGILSNTCHAHWDWIHRQNWSVMDGGFVAAVLSFEVGAMKPDPKIFQIAAKQFDQASGPELPGWCHETRCKDLRGRGTGSGSTAGNDTVFGRSS